MKDTSHTDDAPNQAETRTAEANTRTNQADLRAEKSKAQSESLRASELGYRQLFESARDGILILEMATGRVTDVNPFLIELLGFSHDEMVGKTVGELSPFKDAVANLAMLERLQKEGYVRYDNLPLETRDGRHIEVEFVSNVYQAGDKKVIQCNIRDITARKQAEAVLQETPPDEVARRKSTTAKDLTLICLSTVMVFVVMWYFNLFHTPLHWIVQHEETALDEVFVGLIFLLFGFVWFGFRRWQESQGDVTRQKRVEQALRNLLAELETRTADLSQVNVGLRAEITERQRLARLYTALSQVNKAIVAQHGREELFVEICRVLVESGGFRMACVGWLDSNTRQVIPLAQWGDRTNYLSQTISYGDDRPEGQGPTGTAIREGKAYTSNDFMHDPCTLPWRKAAEQAGFRASAVFVIRQRGAVCGALQVYSDELGFFQDKEIALLEEVASDVSFALDNLEREAAREQAEQTLRHERDFSDAALNSLPGVLYLFDEEGKFLRWNKHFEQVTGYTASEVATMHPLDLFAGTEKELVAARIKEVFHKGESNVEAGFVSKDGRVTPYYFTGIKALIDEQTCLIGVGMDVTEKQKLEAQFRQSQKMEGIGQLAGGVAHDFNNILAVIMMQAEITGMGENIPPEMREGLMGIRAAAERAANLTRQLLLFSRKQVMQPSQLDLNEVVTSLAKMLQRIIREDVRLQLHLHTTPLMTFADAGMLDQVLMNLAVNARDAMPKGGTLLIETAEMVIDAEQASQNPEASPGRFVWLSVSDTGCGMTPEIQAQIFEPFFTTKEVGKGTGLGLATVFGVVKQHKGWLKVSSEVGKGTTFQVYLPASDASAEALAKEAVKPKPRGGTETILVVEDEDSVRMLTRIVLERNGYHVLEAADGVEAQRLWEAHQGRIALLLTDLVMPGGVDGHELAALLQAQKRGLKVIFTSGYSADIAGRALKLQAGQNFVQKPCPPDQLLEAVRNCLDS